MTARLTKPRVISDVPSVEEGDLLFVYGTLKSTERASLSKNERVTLIGPDRISGVIKSGGSYPGVKLLSEKFDSGLEMVVGEVYEVLDASVGRHLDIYEGHPSLFFRTRVLTEQGRLVWVYEYCYSFDNWKDVPDGCWSYKQLTEA